MSNVIPMKSRSPQPPPERSKLVPEYETLLNLAMDHHIKAFQIEHSDHGYAMCMAHFTYDGWNHLYQDGDSAHSKHLFFWLLSWQSDESPEDVALNFFDNQFILSR